MSLFQDFSFPKKAAKAENKHISFFLFFPLNTDNLYLKNFERPLTEKNIQLHASLFFVSAKPKSILNENGCLKNAFQFEEMND